VSTMTADGQVYEESAGSIWWVFLITGTAWLILSLIMFRFNITSAKSIGVLAGIVFLIAGVIEIGMVVVVHGGWWKALNAILALLLIVGGIMSFIHPENTFVAIDLIIAFSDRRGLWWIRLITGSICIGLAFWASGDFNRKAILLTVWVALFCLFRGINSFIVAFTVRALEKESAA
jgi:uncharacterized membrane protein HdeD (DUF308 family)